MVIRKEDFPGRSIDANRNCEILKKAVISHEVHLVKVNLVRTTLELEEGPTLKWPILHVFTSTSWRPLPEKT